jgi:hypothetical protein
MLAGMEREEKGRRKIVLLERVRSVPRSSSHPSYILEVSVADPLDLASLKRPAADVSVNKWQNTLTSYNSPLGQSLTSCTRVPK